MPTLAAKLQGEPVVLEVRPEGVPTTTSSVQLAAPGAGVVDLRATFVANPALPAGSVVALDVTGSDGAERRFPLTRQDTTVRAGLDGSGLADVRIEWVLVRAGRGGGATPPAPAGLDVTDAQVVRWTPR